MVLRKITDHLGTPLSGTPGTGVPTPTPTLAGDAARAPSRALVPKPVPASPALATSAAILETTPPWDGTAALSAALNDLTATLDTLTTVVASLSNRVDSQVDGLNKLTMTAAEIRQAAFAARAQSDPGLLAVEVEQALNKVLLPRLGELTGAVSELSRTATLQGDARTHAESQLLDMKRNLQAARPDALRWKRYIGTALLGSLLLTLAMTVTLPRIVPASIFTCRIIGGLWLSNDIGQEACTFWKER